MPIPVSATAKCSMVLPCPPAAGITYKITAPLFVAAGANDPRVPAAEGEQIAKTVRANGNPVWFLLYKDEGHGFFKKSNRDYFGTAMMQFWLTYLIDNQTSPLRSDVAE